MTIAQQLPAALDLTAIRARYQPDYRPICDGCGQLMECVGYHLYRCRGRVKIGRRWGICPNPGRWEAPTPESRADVLMLCDLAEQARVVERPRDLFSALEVPA